MASVELYWVNARLIKHIAICLSVVLKCIVILNLGAVQPVMHTLLPPVSFTLVLMQLRDLQALHLYRNLYLATSLSPAQLLHLVGFLIS